MGKMSDERLQITQETLSTIRIIKMYTWEKFFSDKIMAARKKEVNTMLWGSFLKLVLIIVGVLFSKLGFYALIMSYVWLGYTNTDTELVYYILMIFKDLEYNIGICIPWGMGKMADCYSALLRINKVISAEELHPIIHTYSKETKPYIEMRRASVLIANQPVLEDVSLDIKSGLVLVTGNVGSGKSSLLKAILQDYPLTSGKLKTEGRLSYASQDPWLFPSSIRQNILFGQKYEEKRYQEVIRVCALELDFKLLEKGDQTIVTDRGLNLSKGQQARVNLARAVYKDSEIYLLDDSLTALDGHVQDYIFNECIKGYLKDKIVLLVTQTASHIQQADTLVIMSGGRVISCGKPDEKLVEEVKKLVCKDDDLEKEDTVKLVSGSEEVENEADEGKALLECEQTTKKKVYFEVKKKGEVKCSTYKKYILFGGGFLMLLLNLTLAGLMQGQKVILNSFFLNGTSTSLLSCSHIFRVDEKQEVILLLTNISISGDITTTQTPLLEEATSKEQWTIKLCSIMMLVSTILSLIKIYTLFDFCRRASINIHKSMIHCILSAVMYFFDTHFIGNVLNRFSQDLNNIDELLPFTFIEFVLFAVTGIIALLATVNVYFLINSFILFGLLTLLRKLYLPTGRSLKRLEAATRSPMIGHLNASLDGLTTIRAYKAQGILTEEFDRHQDLYTSAYFTSLCTSKAFGFFMDSMCSVFIAGVVLTLITMDKGYTAGDVGLAITQVINLADDVQWGVRQWAEIENLMTSVERLVEYTEIKTEPAGGNMVPEWPSKGAITYDKVNLSYTKHDTVLQDISFKVEPKEKIGIVGRTGAGKSSIISTLFRLYEAEGKILVDDVDIKALSLKYLRRKIAIIPQDPVMFSGTIRTNLDPFDEYTDKELWDALDKVSLKSSVTNLDIKTTSHASSFSSGQKQLMCLARAILRRTKIVVLDEATANMDPETDALLHKNIKENFEDCTVLTIAHRMHTILDCDKVLVLDRGCIKEYDYTSNLLANPKGEFYKMVEKAGLLDYLK
nr:unnamed protein product [Callosobruchus analis]